MKDWYEFAEGGRVPDAYGDLCKELYSEQRLDFTGEELAEMIEYLINQEQS